MNIGGVIHLNKTRICIIIGFIVILFFYVFSKTDYQYFDKNSVSLKDVLKLSVSAAKSGGQQIISTKGYKIETKGKTREGANESVTTADFNSHCAMTKMFQQSIFNFKIVSEETANCENFVMQKDVEINFDIDKLVDKFVNVWDITIWIDPLDATQEFTENLHEYVTTMVCVAVKGEPLIGVIHKPFLKETYWGFVGNGKSSNLVHEMPENGRKRQFIISRSHSGQIRAMIQNIFPDSSIREAGGAGYKIIELIKGNADIYVHNTIIKKWDICAGNAIINAVGGKMTTLSNDIISYGSELGDVHMDGLIATIKDHDYYMKKIL